MSCLQAWGIRRPGKHWRSRPGCSVVYGVERKSARALNLDIAVSLRLALMSMERSEPATSDPSRTAGETSEGATSQLGKLKGVSWKWREEAPAQAREQPGMGVIAQDVERVFPELVTTGDDGYKRVNYAGLIGPLIEAVKELDARVKALEARLERSEHDERSP